MKPAKEIKEGDDIYTITVNEDSFNIEARKVIDSPERCYDEIYIPFRLENRQLSGAIFKLKYQRSMGNSYFTTYKVALKEAIKMVSEKQKRFDIDRNRLISLQKSR